MAQSPRFIVGGAVISRSAFITAREIIILEGYRAVGMQRRSVIKERDQLADIGRIRRLVAVGIGDRESDQDLAVERLLNRIRRIIRRGIIAAGAAIIGFIGVAAVVMLEREILRDADFAV